MKDPDDVQIYKQSIERLRVHIFLAGLDKVFDPIRREILRQEPLSSLEECYSLVRREALRSATLNDDVEKLEASAMITRNQSNQPSHNRPKSTFPKNFKRSSKSTSSCSHRNQTGHSESNCFEIIGHPDWWDPTRHKNSKRPPTAAIAQPTKDDGTPTTSALVTTVNTDGKALNISSLVLNYAWIIDSGATDHMTFDVIQVLNLNPSSHLMLNKS